MLKDVSCGSILWSPRNQVGSWGWLPVGSWPASNPPNAAPSCASLARGWQQKTVRPFSSWSWYTIFQRLKLNKQILSEKVYVALKQDIFDLSFLWGTYFCEDGGEGSCREHGVVTAPTQRKDRTADPLPQTAKCQCELCCLHSVLYQRNKINQWSQIRTNS